MNKLKGLLSMGMLSLLGGCAWSANDASAVGVIGGADGPTAVFVTTQMSPAGTVTIIGSVIVILLILIGIVVYIRHRFKGKK